MVTVTPEAEKFIKNILQKNERDGYGIKIYLSGMSCSGPRFGMSFQKNVSEGERVVKSNGFDFFCDDKTMRALEPCVIEYIDDPSFGTGLTIRDPNVKCESCSGCC